MRKGILTLIIFSRFSHGCLHFASIVNGLSLLHRQIKESPTDLRISYRSDQDQVKIRTRSLPYRTDLRAMKHFREKRITTKVYCNGIHTHLESTIYTLKKIIFKKCRKNYAEENIQEILYGIPFMSRDESFLETNSIIKKLSHII